MGPEEAAFLDRVCADADDDAPRLVYADWLDERGDPRGEFIRVQCEWARLCAQRGVVSHGADLWSDRLRAAEKRQAELFRLHGAPWYAELPTLPGLTWGKFERGFVGAVSAADTTPLALRVGLEGACAAAPVT